jgi:fructuronate reductase
VNAQTDDTDTAPDRYLHPATLARLPREVAHPQYDRSAIDIGVVHFGPGAFHRAHQAWFIESLLSRDPRWGICAVSLRSHDIRDALLPQGNLYTLAIRDEVMSYQVIGAIKELLLAPESPEAVLQRLSSARTHVVTLSVTEKGYCLAADGSLDVGHPDVRQDLERPRSPRSVIGFLVEALRRRRDARLPPFTVVSCDNLVDNGAKLARATAQLASMSERSLGTWIEREVSFPRTMVDSITPATTDALKESVAKTLGLRDRWPVQREAFTQWVIEDVFRHTVPDWQSVGITLTNDVAGYDRAKLRLLNGAHSTLAYVGLLRGYVTVCEAMKDEKLRTFVRTLMTQDILPSLKAPRGLDLPTYVESILRRFSNPAMHHELAQIAWDGSQKLPFRLLGTIREALDAQRPVDRLCVPIAAWMRFVRCAALRGEQVKDPLAPQLLNVGRACEGRGDTDVMRFMSLESVFPPQLRTDSRFTRALAAAYDQLAT